MADAESSIALSEVLANIAEELAKANKAAKDRGFAPMKFGECEIDFAVQIGKEGSAGLKVWVIQLGGSIKRSDSNTIKIKFTANPDQPIVAPVRDTGPAPRPQRQSRKRG